VSPADDTLPGSRENTEAIFGNSLGTHEEELSSPEAHYRTSESHRELAACQGWAPFLLKRLFHNFGIVFLKNIAAMWVSAKPSFSSNLLIIIFFRAIVPFV
jgi:hypothetical protein